MKKLDFSRLKKISFRAGEKVKRVIDGMGFEGTIVDIDDDVVSIKFEDGWIERGVSIKSLEKLDVVHTARGKYEAKHQQNHKNLQDFESLPWKRRVEVLSNAKPQKMNSREMKSFSENTLIHDLDVGVVRSALDVLCAMTHT